MFKLKLISCFVLLTTTIVIAQLPSSKIDSLQQEVAHAKNNSAKVDKLLALASITNDFKNINLIATKALNLASTLNYSKGKASAYNTLADAYWYHSDYDKAQQNYFKAYKINETINDQSGIALSLYNIGWIYCVQQHNYMQSGYLFKSLRIYETLKDTLGLIRVYNGIGTYYSKRNNNNKTIYLEPV